MDVKPKRAGSAIAIGWVIMQVKPNRACSALGWVTATRYKIGDSIVTPYSGVKLGKEEGVEEGGFVQGRQFSSGEVG